MTREEAIKYLKQLYPNGGHCWLDEQRIEAIGMAIAALEHEKPVSEGLEEALEQLAENARKHKAETSSPFFSPTDYKQGVKDGANWQKEKVSFIVKRYVDKGEKNYQESVAESIGAAYQQDVYWDGFRDCANGLLRELKDN